MLPALAVRCRRRAGVLLLGCGHAASPKAPTAEVERVAGETGQVVLEDEAREEVAQGVEAEKLVVSSAAGMIGPGKTEVVAVLVGQSWPFGRQRLSLRSSTGSLSKSKPTG